MRTVLVLGVLLTGCGSSTEPPGNLAPALVYADATTGPTTARRMMSIRADGTDSRLLYDAGTGPLGSLAPTPDGATILFYASLSEPRYRTIPSAGGTWTAFPAPENTTLPVWAPNGAAIAWVSTIDPTLGIAMVGATTFRVHTAIELEATRPGAGPQTEPGWHSQAGWKAARTSSTVNMGGVVTPLLVAHGSDILPNWSRARNLITFVRFDPDSNTSGLYVIAPDGSSLQKIAAGPYGGASYWSHDGARIATNLSDLVVGFQPVVVTVATGEVTPVALADAHFPPLTNPWSPDDSQLLLMRRVMREEGSYEVLLVTDLRGNYRQLTPDSLWVTQAVWMP